MAASLADLGDLARRQSSYERAFLLVNQALEIQRKHGSRRSIAVCLHSLGHIEAARASYARAERYLTQALEIQRQQNDRGGMAQTLSTLAMIMANKGEMPKAIKRWNAALEMAREVGDRRMQALLHNSLGEAFSEQRQIEEALKHFKTCEKMAAVLDDQLLLSQVLRNVGVVTQKKGDVQEARNHLEKALELATELEGKEMLGLTYRAIGELDSSTVWDTSKAEIEDTAELSFQKALKIFKSIGNEFEVARTQHALGNRMLERGDISGGKEMLEKAMEIFVRLESKMGEAIGRTIKEISGQANPAKAKDKVTAKNNRRKSNRKVINTASRDAADTVPDLTAELEDIVE
jgi:tetratricopeptide (TPR) repeat protein